VELCISTAMSSRDSSLSFEYNIIVRVYIIYCDIGYSVSIFYTVCVETCSWAHIL
jgi:hypothetical protein